MYIYVIDNFYQKIQCLFNQASQRKIILSKTDWKMNEKKLLVKLDIQNKLNLQKDDKNVSGLFGYKSIKTDYLLKDKEELIAVIEFKKIGLENNKGKSNHNECEIKNGLAQVIEQALCKNAKVAILVIIDGGRANKRTLFCNEKKYISMFKNNPFGISLGFIRIMICKDAIDFELY